MKKIITLFIAVALIASLGVGAIAGANEDAFANAVMEEQAQITLEKAALEFANGNDVEGLAAEEDVTNNFGKTQLGFHKISGAVITASYAWKMTCKSGCVKVHKPITPITKTNYCPDKPK
ncbi:MAG TPA: hypothetical protein PKH80_02000 [Methanofastidiosum sp.]|nr:hypothetical protein [Methanofastidiosum sp.]HNU60910.1 hypothetical protein [Methanofastidiosum sp.]